MKVLVTGGGGFLGGHIAEKLLARGDAVRVLGRRDYPDLAARGVECVRGDVADPEAVARAVGGCDGVIHAASLAGVWGRRRDYERTNVLGASAVLGACLRLGVGRLVYTSTPSVVYGTKPIDGGDESLPYPDRYLTHYARTKAEAERMLLAASGDRVAVCSLRPHLIFGPGDRHLIPKLLARARAKFPRLRRVGDGKNRISVSYVENVADAHVLALDRLFPGSPVAGRAYFVNEPEPVNCWEFINGIVTGAGLPEIASSMPLGLAYRIGWTCEKVYGTFGGTEDPPMTRFLALQLATSHWFRTGRAEKDLGWTSRVPLEEGVRRLIASLGPARE